MREKDGGQGGLGGALNAGAAAAAAAVLTVHVDLLAQFYQLHLRGHVPHRPHAVPQIFAPDEAVFVLVELLEGLPQL